MEGSRGEAVEMLAHADATGRAVRSRAASEYRGYLAWVLWLLVFVPPLDFLNHNVWGPVVQFSSITGTFLTCLYFGARSRHVHLGRAMHLRRWLVFWAAWTPWYVACIIGAHLLEPRFALAWTSAGVAGALPVLVAGIRGWRAR